MATHNEARNVKIAGWLNAAVKTILGCANAAEPSANMAASQVNVWVNETGNSLTFQVKYADGTTVKSGTVALT